MANTPNRYEAFDKLMTTVILGDFLLFFLYFIVAALGVIWLKVILVILIIAVSGGCLGLLYLSRELTRSRSLWMTAACGSMLFCLIFSLILNYPC